MKTFVLVIIMRGWGGEAVAVHHIPFQSIELCDKAAINLLRLEQRNKHDRMQNITGVYTCLLTAE